MLEGNSPTIEDCIKCYRSGQIVFISNGEVYMLGRFTYNTLLKKWDGVRGAAKKSLKKLGRDVPITLKER